MINLNRKIKVALIAILMLLIAFVGFSKLGILFSKNNDLIITVSTPKVLFKPKKYEASLLVKKEDIVSEEKTEQEIVETTTRYVKEEKNEEIVEAVPNNNIMDIVSSAVEPSYGGQSLSQIADKLNSHFKGSLSNTGELFAKNCIDKGMDPYLLAAISVHETGNGLSNAALYKYNFGGIMCSSGLCSYSSVEDGITKFIDIVYNNYFSKGLVTAEQMNSKYAASTTWASQVNNHYNNLKNN